MLQKSQIPSGWIKIKLKNICESIQTIDPRKNQNQKFTYIDISAIDNSTNCIIAEKEIIGKNAPSRARQKIEQYDILFSTVRTYLRNIAMVTKNYTNAVCSTGFCVIRPFPPIEPLYVFRYLLTDDFITRITPIQTGTLFPAVRGSDILEQVILLPPLNEQKRIVSKIEELFKESKSARDALDKIPEIMKRFRQSVLAKAFRGELVPQDPNDEPAEKLLERIRQERRRKWEDELRAKGKDPKKFKYEEPEPVETNELPELPKGWMWSNIEFVTENHDGKRVPVSDKERQNMQGKYPYYGASGIIDSVNDYLFDGNYLLIGEDGANLLSRSTPIAFIAKGQFWVNNHAHILTTFGGIPLEYLESYFNSIDLSRWVTGTAQPKLNQKRMNSIPIPIAPIGEQNRLIAKIEELFSFADQIEKSVEEAKKRADRIDQAILAKAFRGELVPQDPSDEPASVLLERIKSEKEKQLTVKQTMKCKSRKSK